MSDAVYKKGLIADEPNNLLWKAYLILSIYINPVVEFRALFEEGACGLPIKNQLQLVYLSLNACDISKRWGLFRTSFLAFLMAFSYCCGVRNVESLIFFHMSPPKCINIAIWIQHPLDNRKSLAIFPSRFLKFFLAFLACNILMRSLHLRHCGQTYTR